MQHPITQDALEETVTIMDLVITLCLTAFVFLLIVSPLFQTPIFFTMLLSMNSTNMTTILSLWSNNHSYFIGEIIMIIVLVFLLLLILKDICCCCCNTKMTPSFMPSLMA